MAFRKEGGAWRRRVKRFPCAARNNKIFIMIKSHHLYPFFPDLIENQRRSVQYFWETGLLEEFELFSYILGKKKNLQMILHGSKFMIQKPKYTLQEAMRKQKSYSVSIFIPIEFKWYEDLLSRTESSFISKKLSGGEPVPRSAVRSSGASPAEPSTQSTPNRTTSRLKINQFSPVSKDRHSSGQKAPGSWGSGAAQSAPDAPQEINLGKKPGLAGDSLSQNRDNNQLYYNHLKNFSTATTGRFAHEASQLTAQPAKRGSGLRPLSFSGLARGQQERGRSPVLERNSKIVPVFLGDIPLMTERGSFLINGSARVLVNQIVRCPSVYFKVKIDQKNRRTYIASFLSDYGSWLRLETDYKNRIWVRIDKSQRVSIYALLRALGFPETFLQYQLKYYNFLIASRESFYTENPTEAIQYLWKKLTPGRWNSIQGCYSFLYNKFFNPRRYSIGPVGRLRLNKRLNRKMYSDSGCFPDGVAAQDVEGWTTRSAAPGGKLPQVRGASPHVSSPAWAKPQAPGCTQHTSSGGTKLPTLTPEDIFMALDFLIQLHYGEGYLDDIDHLKNRRVRLPGELIQNQFRLALSRIGQLASEKITKFEIENDLISGGGRITHYRHYPAATPPGPNAPHITAASSRFPGFRSDFVTSYPWRSAPAQLFPRRSRGREATKHGPSIQNDSGAKLHSRTSDCTTKWTLWINSSDEKLFSIANFWFIYSRVISYKSTFSIYGSNKSISGNYS